MNNSTTVSRVTSKAELRCFVLFPWTIYRDDPNWVPPLVSGRLAYLGDRADPYFQHGDAELFMAYQDGKPVGTVAAAYNHEINEARGEKLGVFGFFECIPDKEVAFALWDQASKWLRRVGMAIMRGPYSFRRTDDPGFLVQGHETRPPMLMGHTPLYYAEFAKTYDMELYEEVYTYRFDISATGIALDSFDTHRLARRARMASQDVGLAIRTVRPETWEKDSEVIRQIFNTAMEHYEDVTPIPQEEWQGYMNIVRPFIDLDFALIAEIDSEPVGIAAAFRDAANVLHKVNGLRYPWHYLRLPFALRKNKALSLKLMGILEDYRRLGVGTALFVKMLKQALQNGITEIDISLVGAGNKLMNPFMERLGCERYRTYQIYEVKF